LYGAALLLYFVWAAPAHDDVTLPGDQTWLLLAPPVFLLVQVFYPTVLGWSLVAVPAWVYSGAAVWLMLSDVRPIATLTGGEYLSGGLFLAAMAAIGVLLFRRRPWRI